MNQKQPTTSKDRKRAKQVMQVQASASPGNALPRVNTLSSSASHLNPPPSPFFSGKAFIPTWHFHFQRLQTNYLSRDTFHTDSPGNMKAGERNISVEPFIQARSFEIHAMESALRNATEFSGVKRVFQTLPRWMRRRAASHNVKRIPVSARRRAQAQMLKDPNPKKPRKASNRRKKRRSSKVQEYLSRQKLKAWLETHVWHAKRMHMVTLWGFKIALHPNDKVRKAMFRAVKHHCMIRDTSYIQPVLLEGKLADLRRLLYTLSSPMETSALNFRYLDGSRRVQVMLYEYLTFPTKCIGPAHFLWCPSTSSADPSSAPPEEQSRKLWIWLHPAITKQVLENLEKAVSALDLSSSITIRPPDNTWASFTLQGPRAQAVLNACLHLIQDGSEPHQIWDSIRSLHSSTVIPPGVVLGLNVHDPRLQFPGPKFNVGRHASETATAGQPHNSRSGNPALEVILERWPSSAALSRLWDVKALKAAPSIPTDTELNSRRAKSFLPGTPLTPGPSDPSIPILLCQGNAAHQAVDTKHREFVSGWTIILPHAWARPFWRSFIFAGARAGGLQQEEMRCHEGGMPAFPLDYPLTPAHDAYRAIEATERREKHARTQAGKRIQYEALDVPSPFIPDFAGLKQQLPGVDSTPFLLHGQRCLALLDSLIRTPHPTTGASRPLTDVERTFHQHLTSLADARSLTLPWPGFLTNAFVQVKISFSGKGTVSACGIIYRPDSFAQLALWKRYPLPNESAYKTLPKSIIGYVTSGEFALSEGKSQAFGAIAVRDLYQIYKTFGGEAWILVRDTKTRFCRVATFDLIS